MQGGKWEAWPKRADEEKVSPFFLSFVLLFDFSLNYFLFCYPFWDVMNVKCSVAINPSNLIQCVDQDDRLSIL